MLLDDIKLVCKTRGQNELASSVLQCVSSKLMDMVKVEGARWRMVVKKMREGCEEKRNIYSRRRQNFRCVYEIEEVGC